MSSAICKFLQIFLTRLIKIVLVLRDIMALDAPETEVSKEVLGGRDTLRWVEGIFESRLVGRDRDRNVISPN